MDGNEFRKIPGVDKLLTLIEVKKLIDDYGKKSVTKIIQMQLDSYRQDIINGKLLPESEVIIQEISQRLKQVFGRSLKSVINATGIILHTNLSRAPLGEAVLKELTPVIRSYSNLEFDLKKGKRGQRNSHISDLLAMVTGAEDAVVVNNNAAAVMLILKTFAEGKEVVISRGELIEIGGSFRIPDIMEASGAKMIEVGTTNRTRIEDYEKAINPNTAMIFKAHKSNYKIKGFTEEASLNEISLLAKKNNIISVYDLGSGLLRRPDKLNLRDEPDVKSCLQSGIDIVSFSGDKLMGGPQAGIIVGAEQFISNIAKAPMMRALRVGKLTIAALRAVISWYFSDEKLMENIPLFSLLNRSTKDLERMAEQLQGLLKDVDVEAEVVPSKAQVGGGTLPDLFIDSFAVKIKFSKKEEKKAEGIFRILMQLDEPVIGILREGDLLFDMQSVLSWQLKKLSTQIKIALTLKS